jgi:hypothetical protein
LLKHESSKTSTNEGITISIRPLSVKAFVPIRTNFDSASNATNKSDAQQLKHPWPSISIDGGITRSVNPLQLNVHDSIRINFDFDSNAIDESDRP